MPLVMRIRRIHHLTVAVRDVERAREAFEALFAAKSQEPRDIEAFGVRTRDLAIGDGVLQLAAPRGAESPITRFIERKGEGFYNLALEVDDIDAAVSELAERGIKVSEPIEATPGVRSAFVTMAATHGLSVQLVEVLGGEERPAEEEEAASEATDDAPNAEVATPENEPLDLTPDEWSDVD
jgi:methylmalonyl-CoA epimerase